MFRERSERRNHNDDDMDDSKFIFMADSDYFDGIKTPPDEGTSRNKPYRKRQSNQEKKQQTYGKSITTVMNPLEFVFSTDDRQRNARFSDQKKNMTQPVGIRSSGVIGNHNINRKPAAIKEKRRKEMISKNRTYTTESIGINSFLCADEMRDIGTDCSTISHPRYDGSQCTSKLLLSKTNSEMGNMPKKKKRKAGIEIVVGSSLEYNNSRNLDVNDVIVSSSPDSPSSNAAVAKESSQFYSRHSNLEGSLSSGTLSAINSSYVVKNGCSHSPDNKSFRNSLDEEVSHDSTLVRQKKQNRLSYDSKRAKSHGIDPKIFYKKKSKEEEYVNPIKYNSLQHLTRRKSPRLKVKKDDVIDLLSSDDEGSSSSDDDNVQIAKLVSLQEVQSKRKKLPGSRERYDVARIAIGKKVFSTGCMLELQTGTREPRFIISFSTGESKNIITHHEILLDDDTLKEFKYFVRKESYGQSENNDDQDDEQDDDNQLPFFALRVSPNEVNELAKYSNSYTQSDNKENDKTKKWYIVIEFRSDDSLNNTLESCRNNVSQLSYFFDQSCRVSPDVVSNFTTALHEDDINLLRLRTRKSKRKKKANFLENNSEVVLVYPFEGNNSAIEGAAVGLAEINKFDHKYDDKVGLVEKSNNIIETNSDDKENEKPISPNMSNIERSHFLTIRGDDVDRLEPGEFLNDTLIDFWMQWIWRKEPTYSNVHFFSSHFYSALKTNGIESVESWTHKKGINIFEKSFVFIPINESLHWSLCVVVNPGSILAEIEQNFSSPSNDLVDSDNDDLNDEDELVPCLLFLDSLKAHRSKVVAKNVRAWLLREWELSRDGEVDDLARIRKCYFSPSKVPIIAPKIPYQSNSWDCGVFVCRYAYALYSRYLNGWRIKEKDIFKKRSQLSLHDHVLTDSAEFAFGMSEIGILRDEMKVLVRNLSDVFKSSRKEKGEDATIQSL